MYDVHVSSVLDIFENVTQMCTCEAVWRDRLERLTNRSGDFAFESCHKTYTYTQYVLVNQHQ